MAGRAALFAGTRMSIEDLFGLNNKVAFVSGASSGIGLHVANVLGTAGCRVAVAARRKGKIEAAVDGLVARGHSACAVPMDVTDISTIASAFDEAETTLGGTIDILVNNAGVIYLKSFLDQEEALVQQLFDTNLKGAFLTAQEAARRMVREGRGSIINMASVAGLRAAGFLSSYAAAKAGLLRLTEVMALELARRGVRVNAICPGNFETDMHQTFVKKGMGDNLLGRIPMRRFGRPEDLDGSILLLASDAGRYITGASITVDGGQALSWM